jgi:DNA polymerase III epsilon subunit-like protein
MKLSDKFTVFDTETNSPDPKEARVLQIGLAIFKDGELKASGSRLVNPGVQWDRGRFVVQGFDGVGIEIPKDAFAVHGLGIDDVEKMPSMSGRK